MSERWQRVGALFERALSLAAADRTTFIRTSGEPPDIQDEVMALLKSHEVSDGFLEPPSLLEPGSQVGAYRIDRVLGRGGMGVVYLAHDTRLHRKVALKSVPPHLFRDPTMHARLKQEARAAAALSHPAIATVYALEEIGGQLYIASEYLEGRNLRHEINDSSLDTARVLAIAADIAKALAAAHERGIVHRDLKPENIILTTSGAVKVVDFGLAQFDVAAEDLASVTRLTDPGTMMGTPPYMAPEQLEGKPTSARTDQFAFGVLLYELMTGRYPFGSGPLPAIIAKVLKDEIEPAPMDERIWAVIRRATQKEPEDRFPTMAELLTALGTGHDSTVRTVRTLRTLRTLRWWETHQLVVALAYWGMAWPAWQVHRWTGRFGVLLFFGTLVIIVVGANIRLHLWFISRTDPSGLIEQRANVAQWVRAADILFAVIMTATGLAIADDHTGWGALFISFGIGAAVAFTIIEPATARAAFRGQR
jgi:tRNA A-37 threonylcarbamoyl transferase component Bud32